MSTVLIVDNGPANRQSLAALLGQAGHHVLEAGSGDEALVLARADPPDLIITDIVMPTMDGYDFARLVRADPLLNQVPIVFYASTYAVAETRRLAEAVGVAHIIARPAAADDILLTVDLALGSQPAAWQPVSEAFHEEHMRLLTDKLAAKVDELEAEMAERRRAEQVVKESEARYRLLFDRNPMPLWVYDLETLRFLAVNDAAVEHYGYSRDEFLALTVRDLHQREDVQSLETYLSTSPATLSRSAVWQHRKKDGTVIEVEIVSHAIDFAGRSARLALANDVTQRRRAEAEVQRQFQRMAALRAIDMAISASLDLRLTLNIVLDHVVSQLHVDAADMFLLRPRTNVLEYAAGRGYRQQGPPDTLLRLGQDYAGRVALERRTLSVPDLASAEAGLVRVPAFEAEGFRAYFAVPLVSKGMLTGVLEVFQRAPLYPDSTWLDFLEAMAGQAAIAIDNARLFDDLQRSNLDLSLAYDATIEGWSRALDLRDHETEGHTQRVTELALGLALRFGIGEAELVHVRRGALLHDIGKMGIPDSILLKPGPLTADEWVTMRKHPVYALDMLSPIQHLQPALDIPYCHHEKWDGTGYPRGLKGEEIPLSARIFAAADVWDALTSDRPYRGRWPDEQARDYIRAQAGQHFDPTVVDAFLQLT